MHHHRTRGLLTGLTALALACLAPSVVHGSGSSTPGNGFDHAPCAVPEEAIRVPDPALEVALRDATLVTTGPLTCKAMRSLVTLEARASTIRSLEGLQHATNLAYLDLSLNFFITDLSPLRSLPKLAHFAIVRASLTDISPLGQLRSLVHLDLSENEITDVSALADLTNLQHLELRYNRIDDMTPLEDLVELRYLDLAGNGASDIAPLAHLTALTHLDIWANGITDVTPLAQLTDLTYLDLGSNLVMDLTPLSALTELVYLDVGALPATDIAPLAYLANLEVLLMSRTLHEGMPDHRIDDLTPLAGLTRLRELDFSDNKVSDLSPIAGLVNLRELSFQRNRVTDITPLMNNPALGSGASVYLTGNCIDTSEGSLAAEQLRQLRARGVTILSEPQDHPCEDRARN